MFPAAEGSTQKEIIVNKYQENCLIRLSVTAAREIKLLSSRNRLSYNLTCSTRAAVGESFPPVCFLIGRVLRVKLCPR